MNPLVIVAIAWVVGCVGVLVFLHINPPYIPSQGRHYRHTPEPRTVWLREDV